VSGSFRMLVRNLRKLYEAGVKCQALGDKKCKGCFHDIVDKDRRRTQRILRKEKPAL
jgi:hypothetical protein